MSNSKILNTKFVFLGTRGDTIYECIDQQKTLKKEQKTYRKALIQFNNSMDQLEGINAFLVNTFSWYTTEGSAEEIKLHDWQKRIINLYIQLIADSAEYQEKIDELQSIIDALQAIIDGFCENGSGVGIRISYYKTQISKLISEIDQACRQLGVEFNYAPINHGSKKIHTIYQLLYKVVMKEYDKQKNNTISDDYVDGERYNSTDDEPIKNNTISDEIANALLNPDTNPESTILDISNFANAEEFKFETKYNGKDVDVVKDGVIDAQDIAEITTKIANKDTLTDEEKEKYDINSDGVLDEEDIKAASSLVYTQTDDEENKPKSELNNVTKESSVEPTDPTDEPTDPTVDPTEPTDDPVEPIVDPTDEPIDGTTDDSIDDITGDPIVDPTDDPVEPTEPTDTTDDTDQTNDPTEP